MPRKSRTRTVEGGTVPDIVNHENDAGIIKALVDATASPPQHFIGLIFKAIWVFKRHARAVLSRRPANMQIPAAEDSGSPAADRKHGPARGPGNSKGVKWQVKQGQARLKKRLQDLDLDMVVVAGDGNCQFRSCSHQLFGCESHHEHIRAATVDYMRQHAADFQDFFAGNEFSKYLERMRRCSTWGDELTLRGICNCFGCHIHVVTSQEHNWYLKYTPDKMQTRKHVFLAYISPAHYNGITSTRAKASLGVSSSSPDTVGGACKSLKRRRQLTRSSRLVRDDVGRKEEEGEEEEGEEEEEEVPQRNTRQSKRRALALRQRPG